MRCDPRAQSLAACMTSLIGKRGKLATLGAPIFQQQCSEGVCGWGDR